MSEFPTAWHRERYIADLEREVEGAERRVAELKELGDNVVASTMDAAKEAVANAKAELERAKKTSVPEKKAGKEPSGTKKPDVVAADEAHKKD